MPKKSLAIANKRIEDVFAQARPGLLRYLYRFVGADDAQDVLQDTFERFLRLSVEGKIASGEELPWLYRVAHNRAIDMLRYARKHVAGKENFFAAQLNDTAVERKIIAHERDAFILDAAARFDKAGRGLLLYHLLLETGMPPEKIAASLQMKPRTCRRFMDNLFTYIQSELRRQGFGPEDF